MRTESTTELVRMAVKAGLNMREVSERLDSSAKNAGGLRKFREWVLEEIFQKEKQIAMEC